MGWWKPASMVFLLYETLKKNTFLGMVEIRMASVQSDRDSVQNTMEDC